MILDDDSTDNNKATSRRGSEIIHLTLADMSAPKFLTDQDIYIIHSAFDRESL